MVCSCSSNKREYKGSNSINNDIADNVIQAFLNDDGTYEKLSAVNIEYLKANIQQILIDTISEVEVRKYVIPPECGSCSDYFIVSLRGKLNLAMPTNPHFWLEKYADIYSDSLSLEDKSKLSNYLGKINNLQKGINAFLSIQFTDKEEAIRFTNQLLKDYIFDDYLKNKINDGSVSDIYKYGLSNDLLNKTGVSYYWLNGSVIFVDWNLSTANKILNIKVLKPELFINTRY